MEMTTCQNHRLEVTLPTGDLEWFGAAAVFCLAMEKLGNASECRILSEEEITEEEINKRAGRMALLEYVKATIEEEGNYTARLIVERLQNDQKEIPGMDDHGEAAKTYALRNKDAFKDRALEALMVENNMEINQRREIALGFPEWKIKIIGEMPGQVGTCRFRGEFRKVGNVFDWEKLIKLDLGLDDLQIKKFEKLKKY